MSLRDGLVTHPSVKQRYGHLVDTGKLKRDPAQEKLAAALDRVMGDIDSRRLASKSSALGWLFARKSQKRESVRGLYVHGGVGRGKTMLMDMFYELVPITRKRRAHFNDFMADVHDRIGLQREAFKAGKTDERDPIVPVADDLAKDAWVLCFDEFSVTDIADAMILSRLFSALFARGIALVATSNVAPDDLYRDGLNRGLFEPFIGILEANVTVLPLDSDTDYRLEKLNRMPVYVSPLGERADRQMDEAWAIAANGHPVHSESVEVKARKVPIPQVAGNAARFSFADLCEQPLAARDYAVIARRYGTIFIDRVPVIDQARRNAAKRFILLIDTLYDTHTHLVISAAAAPDDLYTAATGTEAFEFKRTASRLIEMQSRDWITAAAGARKGASNPSSGAARDGNATTDKKAKP